jgi:microcystin-dependent protein
VKLDCLLVISLQLAGHPALYSILGVQYGGDGKQTFALPNLQGRAALGQGAGPGLTTRQQGEVVGTSTVTLLQTEIPAHTHVPNANKGIASNPNPTDNIWGSEVPTGSTKPYAPNVNTPMNPLAVGVAGGSQPHNNMQPYLALNYIIALEGIFPPKS